jgi:hypothetical protein
MLVGAIIAFLFIFGLFLSMLAGSPQTGPEPEWSSDTDTGQELLTPHQLEV